MCSFKGVVNMKKILIVDDDPDVVDLIKNRLETNAYEVFTASNGIEAFALCEDFTPDLILLDVCMPTMDGYKFIQEIKWKSDFKDIPILILSARSQTKDLFAEEGFDSFIQKPFHSDDLLRQIDNCLKAEKVLPKKKVLVVDDECDLVELLESRLEANGYEVVKAINGRTGLKKAKDELPDVIILDVCMPKIDGFNVCRILKSNPKLKDVPVIILTSRATKNDRKIGREIQADEYLVKPFEAATLLKKVEELAKG